MVVNTRGNIGDNRHSISSINRERIDDVDDTDDVGDAIDTVNGLPDSVGTKEMGK
jgi:hypothetical protein